MEGSQHCLHLSGACGRPTLPHVLHMQKALPEGLWRWRAKSLLAHGTPKSG